MGNLLSGMWGVGETGGFPGHHVIAKRGLDRSPVKAVSPAARGRSEAESLDRGEASRRMSDVMARLVWTCGAIARGTRVRRRRRRRLDWLFESALDVSLVLVPEALELLLLGV